MQIYLLFAAFLHRVNTHTDSNSPLISLHLRQSRLRISIEQDIMFTASTNEVPTEACRFKSGQPSNRLLHRLFDMKSVNKYSCDLSSTSSKLPANQRSILPFLVSQLKPSTESIWERKIFFRKMKDGRRSHRFLRNILKYGYKFLQEIEFSHFQPELIF